MAIAKFTIEMAADLGQLRKDVANINAVVSQMGGTIAKAYAPGAAALAGLGEAHTKLADQAKLSAIAQQKSARQVQFQNIQMANQLQDFAVQVAGGANPMLALAQQGSQLSAVYGGFRPALAALAGLITPMNIALAAGAVAVGSMAAAWYQGSKEAAEFRRSLDLTGNAAGMTADRFDAMVQRISVSADLGKGKVREIAQALLSSGRFGPGNIEQASQTAALMAQITGKSAEDVAQQFVQMADAPAQFAASANKSLHFLTDSELRYIQRMESNGQRYQAVYALLGALSRTYTTETAKDLSLAELRWAAYTKWVSDFWDSLKRKLSSEPLPIKEQISQLEEAIARAAQLKKDTGYFEPKKNEERQAALAALQEQQRLLKMAADKVAAKGADETAKTEARALEERLRGAQLALQASNQAYQVKRETLKADAEIYALETRLSLGVDASPQTQAIIKQAIAKQELIKLDEQEIQLKGDLARAAASVIDPQPETALAAQQQKVQIQTKLLELDAQRLRSRQQLSAELNRIALADFDEKERWGDKLVGMEAVSREYEFQRSIIGATTLEAQRLADVRAIELRHLAEVKELERRRDIDVSTRAQRETDLEDARRRQLDAYAKLHAERYRQIYDAEAGVAMAVREYGVRVAQAGDRAREATSNILQSMEDGIVNFVTTGKANIKDFANVVIQEFARIRIAQPFAQSLAGGDWLSKLLGGGEQQTVVQGPQALPSSFDKYLVNATGNAFGSAGVQAFANGGSFTNSIVNSPTLFKFAKGSRLGLMGEAGSEAIMPLKRDSQGRLGVVAAAMQGGLGAVSVEVNITNQGGAANEVVSKTISQSAGGGFKVDVLTRQLQDAMADNVAAGSGSLYHAIGSRFAKSGAM